MEEVKASLAGLLAGGAIEYVGAPAPTSRTGEIVRREVTLLAGRIESPDPFEVIGVPAHADTDELRSAYLELLRRCDPSTTADPQLRPMLRRMSNQLAGAFKEIERRRGARPSPRITKGYDRHTARIFAPRPRATPKPADAPAATVPPSRVSPVPKPDREAPVLVVPGPQVEPLPLVPNSDPAQALKAATEAGEAGRFVEALAILHEAIPALAGRDRRAARVLKARVLRVVENGAKLAEEELRAAIIEDRNADAHVVLGEIYQERGSPVLAMTEYRKALEIQPRNQAAREALDRLQTTPSGGPAGASVLQKLFG